MANLMSSEACLVDELCVQIMRFAHFLFFSVN